MELGFLNANRTAYTCNMFDKKKKSNASIGITMRPNSELQSRTLQC